MTWQRSLQAAVRSLRKEEQRITKQLESVRSRIAELQGLAARGGAKGGGRRAGAKRPGRLSAKGREAIARAARRRWAAYRAQKQKASR